MAQVHDIRITLGTSGPGPLMGELAFDLVSEPGSPPVTQVYGVRLEIVPLGTRAGHRYDGPQVWGGIPTGRRGRLELLQGGPAGVHQVGFGQASSQLSPPTLPLGQEIFAQEATVEVSPGGATRVRRRFPLAGASSVEAAESAPYEEVFSPSVQGRLRLTPSFRLKGNRNWLTSLGYSPERLGQQTLLDLLASESISAAYEAMAQVQRSVQARHLPLTLRARNGELHSFAATLKPVRTEGGGVEVELLLDPDGVGGVGNHASAAELVSEPTRPPARGNGSPTTQNLPAETRRAGADESLRQQLATAEGTLQSLFATAPVGICITSAQGIFEQVNPTYCAIYGYTEAELIGKSFTMVVEPADVPKWKAAHERFIDGKADVRGEFNVVTKAGKRLTILADSGRIMGADGQPKKVTYVLDITERKRSEQLLKLSEERNRTLIETAPVGICVTSAEGHFESVNETYCAIYGYERSELIGQHFSLVVPANERPKWVEAHNRFIEGRADVRGEFTVVTKKGKRLTILADSARITGADGQPKKVTYVLDITERKRSEQLLRQSEDRLQSMVNAAPVGICVTNAEGAFEAVNDAYLSIYGYTRDELVGQSFTMVVPGNEKPKWLQAHERFIAGQADVRGEFNVITKAGKRLTILADSARITGADGGVKKVTYVLDITERKRAEQLLKLSEERNRQLIDSAPVGICVTDEEGAFESVNDTYTSIYGFTRDELIGKHFSLVVPAAERDKWVQAHNRFIAGQADVRGEFSVMTKHGKRLAILADSIRTQGVDGRMRKVTFVVDITERKLVEHELRAREEEMRQNLEELQATQENLRQQRVQIEASEARFRSLVQQAPVGICVTDPEARFESVNSTYCDIYGYSVDELIGQPFTLVVPKSKIGFWKRKHDEFLAGRDETRGEFNVIAKDGRELTILADSLRIQGPDGQPRKVTFVIDITERKKSEELIRQSEERLNGLINTAPVGICITDEAGDFESVNSTYCQIYGYSEDELVGKPFTTVVPVAKMKQWQTAHDRFIAGEADVRGEFTTLAKDGRELTILADSMRMLGPDGNPRKVTFVLDISERKRAEELLKRQESDLRQSVDQLRKAQELMQLTQKELQLSEALSRSVLESAPVGIFITNHEGAFETVNATYSEMYGYAAEDMVGQPFTLVVPTAERSKWKGAHDRFMAGTAELRGEFVTQNKSGRRLTIMADSARITGLDGLPKRVTFVVDITRRKEAEAEIRKLSLVASKTDNGILIVNAEGQVEWTNEGLTRLTGIEFAEVMGRSAPEALPTADKAALKAALDQAMAKRSSACELSIGKGGSARLLSANLTPVLRDSGELEQVVMVVADITERKKKEEELALALREVQTMQDQILISEKMAALGQLIAGVAHEVNTPISAVKASVLNMRQMLPKTISDLPQLLVKLPKTQLGLFTELVEASVTAEASLTTKEERQVRRQIAELLEQSGVERAEELADNLVEIRVIERVERFLPLLQSKQAAEVLDLAYKLGQIKVNMHNIDLASDKTAKVVSALKNYSHVQTSDALVNTRLEESVETILTLYQNQFKHGIALERDYDDAIPEVPIYPDELGQVWTNILQNAIQAMKNEGRIEIRTFRREQWAVVEITDSGPGIPPEIMHRIFEPFFTTKGQGEGTGLGLDITRKIVEKHRGQIEVDSVPGRTSFRVLLPIEA